MGQAVEKLIKLARVPVFVPSHTSTRKGKPHFVGSYTRYVDAGTHVKMPDGTVHEAGAPRAIVRMEWKGHDLKRGKAYQWEVATGAIVTGVFDGLVDADGTPIFRHPDTGQRIKTPPHEGSKNFSALDQVKAPSLGTKLNKLVSKHNAKAKANNDAVAAEAARQARHKAGSGQTDPGFGQIYGTDETPSYVTTNGEEVWMWRKGQRVRFYTRAGKQVGPEQANVAPAVAYAISQGWSKP